MKKILILGAGYLQQFAIKKAKELGYYVLAIDQNHDAVGFKYADEYKIINIIDEEACLEYAMDKDIDGVITVATDYGVLTSSYISQELNIPGLNYDSARIIKNKYLTRKVLYENNVDDISQFYEINAISELESIIFKIKYPVIVKPADGSGSKGIQRVGNKEELYNACQEALNISLIKKILIEDFIKGSEYGVESFVIDEEVHVLGTITKEMTSPPYYSELGHSMPSNLNNEEYVKKIVKQAIKSLEINFGAVNMDVLITNDGRVCIVDVGARMGGNLIGSHLIPRALEYDYMANLIKASCSDSVVKPNPVVINSVATNLLALSPGKIKKIPDFKKISEEYNLEIFFNKLEGDCINKYRNNLDGCGYILSSGGLSENLTSNIKKVKGIIDNEIIRV